MQRRNSVTVFAILNFLVFAFALIGLATNVPILQLHEGGKPENFAYEPYVRHPNYLLFVKAAFVLGAAAGFVALASGIGMLSMKPWGRTLGLVYAAYGIAMGTLATLLSSVLYLPEIVGHFDTMNEPMRSAMTGGLIGGAAVGAIVSVGYPAALLWFLTRPHIAVDFRGTRTADEPPSLVGPGA